MPALDDNAETAVVLLSGGLDSATAYAMADAEFDLVHAISFDYGQRHSIELQKASELTAWYGRRSHKIVQLPRDLFVGGVLTDYSKNVPSMSYDDLPAGEVSPTYVPFRNANLISQAVAYAMTMKAQFVYVGMHSEDAHNDAYPDCTPEFLGAMAAAVRLGTYGKVRLYAPFTFMKKHEIVAVGRKLHVPYDLTWSCYRGAEPACGTCSTCRARREAFMLDGGEDPIRYQEA